MEDIEGMVEQLDEVTGRWVAEGKTEGAMWSAIVEHMRRSAIVLEELRHIDK